MHVAEVVEITRGVLKNAPCIHAFSHVSTNPKDAKGGLFIALHAPDITQALECGAYGVLYDQEMPLGDLEIAWIFVPQVTKALERLLRYHLLDVCLLCMSRVEFAILSRILSDPSIVFFEGESVELLNLSLRGVSYIVTTSRVFKDFFSKELELEEAMPCQILLQQLFSTSILYQGARFDLKLPSFYAPQLGRTLCACHALNLSPQLEHLGVLPFMRASYTNDALELCPHGFKVLVDHINSEEMPAILTHTRNIAPWHSVAVFSPTPLNIAHQLYHDSLHLQTLLHTRFSLGFVLGDVQIETLLRSASPQGSLFG